MKRYKTPEEIAEKINKKLANQIKKSIKACRRPVFSCDGEYLTASEGCIAIRTPLATAAPVQAVLREYYGIEEGAGVDMITAASIKQFDFSTILKKGDRDQKITLTGTYNATPEKKTAHNILLFENESGSAAVALGENYFKIIKDAEMDLYTIAGKDSYKSPVYFELGDTIQGVILPVHPAGGIEAFKKLVKGEEPAQEPEKTTQEPEKPAQEEKEMATKKVIFTDGTTLDANEEMLAALADDPLVASIDGEPVKTETAGTAEEITTARSQEPEKPAADEKPGTGSQDKKPAEVPTLTPDDVTPANYREICFQFFGGFGKKTNAELILLAGVEAGAIDCDTFKNYLFNGVTPPFHTFETWKQAGFIVKKGEKAAFKANIWKYTEKHGKLTAEEAASLNSIITGADGEQLYHEGDDTTKSNFIMKLSFFFGPSQVDKIEVKPFEVPEGVEITTDGNKEILTGDTKPHKDAIKAAGFSWNRKESFWYRYKTA